MKSTMKTKTSIRKKQTVAARRISFADAEKLLTDALKAEPKDLKVPISVRLDGDVYLELKKLAEAGYGDGKYQLYMNQILRHHLFGEVIHQPAKGRRKTG